MASSERILVTRHSAYNLIQVTEDDAGFRTLRFGDDGVCQSVVKLGDPKHLELPYARLLPSCLALVDQPARMLIVGLGGGTLPAFFHNQFPELEIDVVEIDKNVVQIAREYCGFDVNEKVRVHINDGRDFIENCHNVYDIVILDSFNAETIPPHLATSEFLQAVKAALTPRGIAVANIWGRSINRLYDHMLRTYRHVFEESFIFDVPAPRTKLFVALQQKRALSRNDVVELVKEFAAKHGIRHDLSRAISGFRNSDDEHLQGGGILKDSDIPS